MAPFVQKKRLAVAPIPFTVDGTTGGVVTIADTTPFFVGQIVVLTATGLDNLTLQVKRVTSATELIVGPTPYDQKAGPTIQNFRTYTDISAYTVALNAEIQADEQIREPLPDGEIMRAVYQEEPAVALRTHQVDALGESYSLTNPLPITPSIGGFTPPFYDTVNVTYDVLGNPLTYVFVYNGNTVGTITVTYDVNFNPISYVRT